MDDGAQWIIGAILIVIGVLLLAMSWRAVTTVVISRAAPDSGAAAPGAGAAADASTPRRTLSTSRGTRWWSLQLPAAGLAMVVMGVLFGAGFPDLALAVLYVLAGIGVVLELGRAVRARRSGRRRDAAVDAGVAVYIVVTGTSILLGPDLLTQLLVAIPAGVLLLTGIWVAARRWSGADSNGARPWRSVSVNDGASGRRYRLARARRHAPAARARPLR